LEKGETNMTADSKVAIITLAETGINKSAAPAFLNNDYNVTFAGRRKDTLEIEKWEGDR
jgi:NADP-dependent 3-hydroxy acid dehydrogenase YdfG